MRNIAIIPARSGSKGLIDKNIRILNGKPLMVYTIEAALRSGIFDEIHVSTDSSQYADIAVKAGGRVPFLRDEIYASDTASSWDVVTSVLQRYEQNDIFFDNVALLQPTSPLRTEREIVKAFDFFCDKQANAVISVCKVDHSPVWTNVLPHDLSLKKFISDDVKNKPRQEISDYYRINGAMYFTRVEYIKKTHDLYQDRCFAYVMDKMNSIDIDDIVDFICAEGIMKYKNNNESVQKSSGVMSSEK